MHFLKPALVILICLMASIASAGNPVQNDAGSGGDAGDSMQTALALAAWDQVYHGSFTPHDSDWYRLPALPGSSTGLRCIEFSAAADDVVNVTLARETGGTVRSQTAPIQSPTRFGLNGNTHVHGGMAVTNPNATYLGFTPGPNPDGNIPANDAIYGFHINARSYESFNMGDADLTDDASANRSTATALPGDCVDGSLNLTRGDVTDVYQFQGKAGEVFGLSLAAATDAPVVLRLVAPNGDIKEEVQVGGVMTTTLDADGTWYVEIIRTDVPNTWPPEPSLGLTLQMSSTSATSTSATSNVQIPYLIGVVMGPDRPGPPCRPNC